MRIFIYSIVGAKVHLSSTKTRIIDPGGASYSLDANEKRSSLPDEACRLLSHVDKCLARCKRLEKVIEELSDEDERDNYFPLIVSRRSSSKASQEKTPNQKRYNK